MADIDTGGGGGGRGRKGGGSKTKKKSTKVDMTAMVDVAFLLLTFFVLTAVITDEAVMPLTMPPKAEDVPEEEKKVDVDEAKVVTLVLTAGDTVVWYTGVTDIEPALAGFDPKTGVRKVILDHLRKDPRPLCTEFEAKFGRPANKDECWDPIFLIKPRYNSSYGNLVDLLDEMAITNAPKYAIDKFTEADSMAIFGEPEEVPE
ncbi:MAG: biopolymer transporter ExbD [Bacteroidia bacterium]